MILRLNHISYGFSDSKDAFRLINGLHLNVERGKVTAIIGSNGSGKTTLFNIISGLIEGYKGMVTYFPGEGERGVDLGRDKEARKQIGRLFQSKGLFPNLTLLENMKLASSDTSGEIPFSYLFNQKELKRHEEKKTEKAILALNSLFGVNNPYLGRLGKKGNEFSYGEQRLLSMATLFMGDYQLWLLDEPTAGVNPYFISNMKDVIRLACQAGCTVLLIEHNMQFVGQVADTVAYLEEGKIASLGAPNVVLNDQKVKDSYIGLR